METWTKQKSLSACGKSVLVKLRRELFQTGISSGGKRERGNNTTPVQAEELQLGLWNNCGKASKAAAGPAQLGRWTFGDVLQLVRG